MITAVGGSRTSLFRKGRALFVVALFVGFVGCSGSRSDGERSPHKESSAKRAWAGLGQPVRVDADGAWSWWQSPLVAVNDGGDHALVGSVASGVGRERESGSQAVSTVDLDSGRSTTEVIGRGLRVDDHNAPAVIELPDGTGVAVWTGHREESVIHVARRAPGTGPWVEQSPVRRPEDPDGETTYSNLVFQPDEGAGAGRLYDFYRGPEQDPAVVWSDDGGRTWTYGGRLFDAAGVRPYVRYAAGRGGRIHFVVTDGHPHDVEGNSLWSGYLLGSRLFRTDGTFVAGLDTRGLTPSRFTSVWRGSTRDDASVQRSDIDGWTSDLAIDAEGEPVVTFSERRRFGDGPTPPTGQFSHQAWYGHWNEGRWQVHPVSEMGGELYEEQPDYTGLTALDPTDPHSLVLSTDVDPRTQRPTAAANGNRSRRELFAGSTVDDGRTWMWTPVTERSATDNIRPRMGANASGTTVLAWLRGTYGNFVDFDLAVVAIIRPPP